MMRTARAQALTPIEASEVEISFYAKSRAGPSPINGHAFAKLGKAAMVAPFPMPPASFGSLGQKDWIRRNTIESRTATAACQTG